MSEIAASEKEESSGTVSESSEGTSDVAGDVVVQNKAELGEEATLELNELQTEDETTLELASVDVTVESKDSENESSSSTEVEDREEQEEQESEEISEDVSLIDGSNDCDEESELDSDREELGEETVTCALLGLEQAKVRC